MTTLLEELHRAALRADVMAACCDKDASEDPRLGGYSNAPEHRAEAVALRARAARVEAVKEILERGGYERVLDVFEQICGPIEDGRARG